jgi:hypothetical protein
VGGLQGDADGPQVQGIERPSSTFAAEKNFLPPPLQESASATMIATMAMKASASRSDISHIIAPISGTVLQDTGWPVSARDKSLPTSATQSAPLAACVVRHLRREMLALHLGDDAADDAGTKLGTLRKPCDEKPDGWQLGNRFQ